MQLKIILLRDAASEHSMKGENNIDSYANDRYFKTI